MKPRLLRLLIVEDHQLDAEFVIRELKKGGFDPEGRRVSTPKDMDVALDAGSWDVVISEYKMPQFTGLEALRLLKRKNPDIPFIIFSGAMGEEMAVECMKAGANDCLGKDKIVRLPAAVEHEINNMRMRQEHARAEVRYRTILQTSMDGFWMVDIQGRLLEVNEAYCRMSGYSEQELLSMCISDLEFVETCNGTVARIQKVMLQGEDRFESRHHRKDGSVFEVEVSVQHRPAEGRLVFFIRDITGRKRMEESLRYEQTLVLTLMENLPDRIYFKDTSSRFLRINPAMVKLFGVSDPAQVIGKSDADFFSAEHAQKALADEQAIMRTGQPILGIEEKLTWPDGHEGWALTSKLPLRNLAGNIIGTCGITRDITERKRVEEALRASEEKYRGLFENSRDAIMTLEPPSWRFTSGNPAAIEMFKAKSEEEFLSCEPWTLSPEHQPDGCSSVEKAKEMIEKTMLKGSHFFEWTHKRIDGEEFLSTVLLSRTQLAGKVFLQASVRDISALRRTEEKLSPK